MKIYTNRMFRSRPRLSVRERQNQRLKTNVPRPTETQSTSTMSHSPYVDEYLYYLV